MKIGDIGEAITLVTPDKLAKMWGSGALDVFATPSMIGYMEKACVMAIEHGLEQGFSTVGSAVNVWHLAPSVIGKAIHTRGELVEIDGRRLTFKVTAWDESGLIGEGTHERFVVNNERFLAKAKARK
ncbi:MAG: thioesterase family protein [Treponema sp.]|jgi:predicted thioesterase|nr:thioesterase family protein [Treponema sp.]